MLYDERNIDHSSKTNIFHNFKCKKVILTKMLKTEFKSAKTIHN